MLAACWAVATIALVLTAASQVEAWRLGPLLKRHDRFGLIPMWTFFAPNPGTTDARLLWREARSDGGVSPWREPDPPRISWTRGLWNPAQRTRKVIRDAAVALMEMDRAAPEDLRTQLTVPYLLLLHYVSVQPASPNAIARQFVLVDSSGDHTPRGTIEPLIVSAWHRDAPVRDEVAG